MLMVIMTMSAVLAQLQNMKKDQTAHVLTKESSLNTLDNMHHPATKLSNLVNAYMCKSEEGACPRPIWHSGHDPAGSISNLLDPNPDTSSTEKQSP